jgi:hypothetical protein
VWIILVSLFVPEVFIVWHASLYSISMDQLVFTISFVYEILPDALQVDLSAEIEMVGYDCCLVREIRRINSNESPLLPEMKLQKNLGRWIHSASGNESNISRTIGEAISRHLSQREKRADENI